MAAVLAIASHKGGVGKTTAAINLAAAWASSFPVLLVDLDPQRNATLGLGVSISPNRSITEALQGKCRIEETLIRTGFGELYLLPSSAGLAALETEKIRFGHLDEVLRPLLPRYEVVVIDCPPSLGLLTINGLTAADRLLVPVKPGVFSLAGLQQVFSLVEVLRTNHINPHLQVLGLFYNDAPARTNAFRLLDAELRAMYEDLLLSTVVPGNVKLLEAQIYGKPINMYDPSSVGCQAFAALAIELLKRWGINPGMESALA